MARYENQNFAQSAPLTVDGRKVGVPLHAGEGPNEYVGCNLINCEPPAGSTATRCNTAIVEYEVNPALGQTRVAGVMVDGQWTDTIVHGRWTEGGYAYLPAPRVVSAWRVTDG